MGKASDYVEKPSYGRTHHVPAVWDASNVVVPKPTVTVASPGGLYAFSGRASNGQWSGSASNHLQRFDGASWTQLPVGPAKSEGTGFHAAGKLWFVGFRSGACYSYDYSSRTWDHNAIPNICVKTRTHECGAAVEYPDQRVMIMGGHRIGATTCTVEMYDVRTDTYTSLKNFPGCGGTKQQRPASTLIKNIAYFAGGRSGSGGANNQVYSYTRSTNTWKKLASMNVARYGATAGNLNGKMIVAGGQRSGHYDSIKSAEIYDPTTNKWTNLPDMHSNHFVGVGGIVAGSFFIGGGWAGAAPQTKVMEKYDPEANTWTQVAPLPHYSFFGTTSMSKFDAADAT